MTNSEFVTWLSKEMRAEGWRPSYKFEYPWEIEIEVDKSTASDWEPNITSYGEPDAKVFVEMSGAKWGCWLEMNFLGHCGGDWFNEFNPDNDGLPPWEEILNWLEGLEKSVIEAARDIVQEVESQRGNYDY